ncbi:IS110 family transposase [Methylomonas sp. 11b]|uniref:IS110 family transposase n=1 Tax=Methylomonas sp. 11b TaxID=1168169 RepID=UPI00047E796B|nr:IS110 family transposase [Methylomonas sp. 11b]
MTSEMLIGIDVAKDELVIDSEQGLLTLANTAEAINAWLKTLPTGSYIGLEATSDYHQLMAEQAVLMGMVVYVLNPRDMRHYALGLGRRGKTDRVDAQMIRRFITAERGHLRPYQPASAMQHQVTLLQRRRATVVKHRQALQKALRSVKELEAPLIDTVVALDGLLKHIDQQLDDLLTLQPALKAEARRLESIPGIGRQTSTQLAVLFDRVPLSRSDAVVAFVGLDPRACDSGQKRGRRRVSKRGPGELRRLLYNCAQAAAKTAVWKPYYQELRAREFSATQALVIIARKLLRIAFSLWQQADARFDAQKIACLNNAA